MFGVSLDFSNIPQWEKLRVTIEQLVDHQFNNPELLLESVVHSSFFNENAASKENEFSKDNERLEFLGDAVISLTVAQFLMERFPKANEGQLSRWRSTLVSRKTLAEIAFENQLGEMILLGRGEQKSGGQTKASILAGTIEAIVGALYLDAGIVKATLFLQRILKPWIDDLECGGKKISRLADRKTFLQEKTQQLYKTTPEYRLIESWGLEHDKYFRMEVVIAGKVISNGEGRNKKDAEQEAAQVAIQLLGL